MNPKGTILVVEDNAAMNNAICDILELAEYEVISAENGQEALEILRRRRPDLVLCDIMMPQMDGYTLLRHTRADERLRTLPFIFLTARSSDQDKRQAKTIGIEDYLVKPVEPEDLVLAVNNVMRRVQYLAQEAQGQMDDLRSQIVRTLQHEFRTPLTFILGYAEYLAEISQEQVDIDTLRLSTSAILEGGHRLQDLIEKFLMLSDIQFRPQLASSLELIDPVQIFRGVQGVTEASAAQAGLEVAVDLSKAKYQIAGEAKYLHKAILLMVENSIQYRRPDSRQVALRVVEDANHVGLQVVDDGRGISPEQVERLNQPFEQLDRDDRTIPGAGLSLALVRHIARLHGGHMSIESALGQGSVFTLWLPKPVQAPSELDTFLEEDADERLYGAG